MHDPNEDSVWGVGREIPPLRFEIVFPGFLNAIQMVLGTTRGRLTNVRTSLGPILFSRRMQTWFFMREELGFLWNQPSRCVGGTSEAWIIDPSLAP